MFINLQSSRRGIKQMENCVAFGSTFFQYNDWFQTNRNSDIVLKVLTEFLN